MHSFQRQLKRKPFVIISIILIIYTILQLLISYHMIEIEFGDHHDHKSHQKQIHKNRKQSDSASSRIFDLNPFDSFSDKSTPSTPQFKGTRFEGCNPIPIDYEWGRTKFNHQRIACLVLSLYPRNKILMQFIGETFGKFCDGLYFILDDSKTHWFNTTVHTKANYRQFKHKPDIFNQNQQIIEEKRNLSHLSTYFGGTIIQLNLTRPSHHKERNTWEV